MRPTQSEAKTNPISNSRNDREGRYFFYSCPGLDLWSVGATRQEAEKKLREGVLLLLMRCSRYDELDYFLKAGCFMAVEVHSS
jgi:predicted RNase H-like HicB family nuclease